MAETQNANNTNNNPTPPPAELIIVYFVMSHLQPFDPVDPNVNYRTCSNIHFSQPKAQFFDAQYANEEIERLIKFNPPVTGFDIANREPPMLVRDPAGNAVGVGYQYACARGIQTYWTHQATWNMRPEGPLYHEVDGKGEDGKVGDQKADDQNANDQEGGENEGDEEEFHEGELRDEKEIERAKEREEERKRKEGMTAEGRRKQWHADRQRMLDETA